MTHQGRLLGRPLADHKQTYRCGPCLDQRPLFDEPHPGLYKQIIRDRYRGFLENCQRPTSDHSTRRSSLSVVCLSSFSWPEEILMSPLQGQIQRNMPYGKKQKNHRRLSSSCFNSNKWRWIAGDHRSSVDDTHAARWLRWPEVNDGRLPPPVLDTPMTEKEGKHKSRSKREGTEHEGAILHLIDDC